MSRLPFWGVGLALAGIAILHWLLTGHLIAISGRLSALVNRLREGSPAPDLEMTEAELILALAEATRAQFGDGAITAPEAPSAQEPPSAREPPPAQPPQAPATHLVFLGALMIGGLASFLLGGAAAPAIPLRSKGFTALFGEGALAWGVLALGGALVGFGARMAGGCTSGHGLCGVSRLQPGSLVATVVFFGAGIAVSFLLEGLP